MKRLGLTIAAVFGMLGAVLVPGAASADPIIEDQRVEAPDRLTVGDRIKVIVKLTADAGTTVTLAPGSLNDPFVLTKQPSTSTNDREMTLTLDMAVFATGDLQLPALRLDFRERNGNTGVVTTRPVAVKVDSILPADLSTVAPRDLKPQAELPEPAAFQAWVPVGVGLGLIAVVVIAFLVLHKRSKRRAEAPAVDEDEGYEVAEDRARGLLDGAAAAFARDGDYVTYYTTLANTLREYLTARFGFPAFAMTTTEMQDQMVRRGMDRWQARIVGGLLNQCDAVVYARYRPASERADHDLTAAYEIIEMSRPGELEPEAAEEAALV